MKKNLILSAALLLSASAAMAQSESFQLKANLKNLGDTVIAVKGMQDMDTLLVKNGKFTYTTTLKAPKDITFASPGSFRGTENKVFRVVAVPGEKAELVGDLKNRFDINGSNFYKQYHQVDLMMEKIDGKINAFADSLGNAMRNGGDKDAIMKEYNETLPKLMKVRNQQFFDYMSQHANEEATATLVAQFTELEDMEKAASLLSDAVKNGRMKGYYQPLIDHEKAEKKAEEESAKKQAVGVDAPDFTLKDINGKDFTLSSLRGKYVILDFWGSWCGWCIKGMPEMKKYYEKYKGKFEIVGVDCNDTEQKWKDAVKKHELPWLHVYNPRANTQEELANNVCGKYGVTGFPTKIVLSPEGKIVKTVIGEDPAFYTLLDELFSK